ncbi:39S ribosomal protein L32, mitochondrial [Vespula pensylvanica]|uniref:Large ribosomal subunit protein bL32m n=1 Tax=Vespula pensylvanica TaxID=30213 RepID=A0A834P3B0_VESPE|nr:39S ribosomal protein L32, mitochondrial [Vespula pensylvanica]KAF7425674.1 hypothetical protein H0235_008112 [Vespula pensylvanica]
MAVSMVRRLTSAFRKIEQALNIIFNRKFPPEALYAIDCNGLNLPCNVNNRSRFSLKDIIGDGFLWGVPTVRRTIEKRMSRRFGIPKYNWKPPVPKTNLLMCPNCGSHHEAGLLCGYCYEKVKIETKEMQDVIQQKLGLSAVEEDVIVIYEGENNKTEEFWKNQKVIEMPKKRPEWFHKNLLEPSTVEPSDSKDIKPPQLA